MNKATLIDLVAKETGLSKTKAGEAVEAVVASIKKSLKKQQEVQLVGFGSFKVLHRGSRKGRNPRTGKEIDIQSKNVVKFSPGKALKDAVNVPSGN